ncbi:hypothetical protein M758_UG124100 [Ceratodon purpureus]|nr:hypothetical protein M758_UG124100 [Ceratodon purpureus]
MYEIATGMLQLHRDGILHRDLKASNVLIKPEMWKKEDVAYREYDPINDDKFYVSIVDDECSVAIYGTRFWRAPEILLGVKNREKSDVYSCGMTCYKVLIFKIPLEHLRSNDYDVVLKGVRPMLSNDIPSWVQSSVIVRGEK